MIKEEFTLVDKYLEFTRNIFDNNPESQKDLAEKIGITQSAISKALTNFDSKYNSTRAKILAFYGFEVATKIVVIKK